MKTLTCAAATRNTAAMAMPAVPAAAHGIAMFRSGTDNPPLLPLLSSVLENVQKAQEKRRGKTRAHAVSRGEVRH